MLDEMQGDTQLIFFHLGINFLWLRQCIVSVRLIIWVTNSMHSKGIKHTMIPHVVSQQPLSGKALWAMRALKPLSYTDSTVPRIQTRNKAMKVKHQIFLHWLSLYFFFPTLNKKVNKNVKITPKKKIKTN